MATPTSSLKIIPTSLPTASPPSAVASSVASTISPTFTENNITARQIPTPSLGSKTEDSNKENKSKALAQAWKQDLVELEKNLNDVHQRLDQLLEDVEALLDALEKDRPQPPSLNSEKPDKKKCGEKENFMVSSDFNTLHNKLKSIRDNISNAKENVLAAKIIYEKSCADLKDLGGGDGLEKGYPNFWNKFSELALKEASCNFENNAENASKKKRSSKQKAYSTRAKTQAEKVIGGSGAEHQKGATKITSDSSLKKRMDDSAGDKSAISNSASNTSNPASYDHGSTHGGNNVKSSASFSNKRVVVPLRNPFQ